MPVDGILIVNKPSGKTSRKTTNLVGRLLKQKKAGHLGTLDPIATGVLPVALGKATRLIRFLEMDDKEYRGVLRLGQATDTQDADGKVVSTGDYTNVSPDMIERAAREFAGEIEQVPPMFSAIKKDGAPLYKLARKGIEIEREPRPVTIKSIEIEDISIPNVAFRVVCSPGTYMRTIAHDLGEKLGCHAHLHSLARTASGPFTIKDAVDLEGLDRDAALEKLIPLKDCLPHFPEVELSPEQVAMTRDGVSVPLPEHGPEIKPGDLGRLTHNGELIAVAVAVEHGPTTLLRPKRVMA